MIQFAISQSDFCSLLWQAKAGTPVLDALLRAIRSEKPGEIQGSWRVSCRPLEAVAMLRIAHTSCPDAVGTIRDAVIFAARTTSLTPPSPADRF